MANLESLPTANRTVILREEFDDYALLFDPSSGRGFGLDAVGVAIWKMLDGRHTLEGIAASLRSSFDAVPDDAAAHARQFIDELISEGLAGYGPP
jgi:SynChlorMet cassette protein ScmD